MKKPHLKKQAKAAQTMVLESSMDHFVRLQEHQREFLAWLEGHEQGSSKGYEAIR